MYLGKIMEIGPAEQIIRDPHNPYTKAGQRGTDAEPALGRRARPAHDLRRRNPGRGQRAAGLPLQSALPGWRSIAAGTEEPPLFDVGPGQRAACWLVEGGRHLPVMPSPADEPATRPGEGAAWSEPMAGAVSAPGGSPTCSPHPRRRSRRARRARAGRWLAAGAGRVEPERVRRSKSRRTSLGPSVAAARRAHPRTRLGCSRRNSLPVEPTMRALVRAAGCADMIASGSIPMGAVARRRAAGEWVRHATGPHPAAPWR